MDNDPYLKLILNVHPLRPIRSAGEHQQAKKALRSLAGDKRDWSKSTIVAVADFFGLNRGIFLQ